MTLAILDINNTINIERPVYSSNERREHVEALFNRFFTAELDTFQCQEELKNKLIKNCTFEFTRSRTLKSARKVEHTVNFVLNISKKDYKSSVKKNFPEQEFCRFNFKIIDCFDERNENKIFTNCYFSEIHVDDNFQGVGLFSLIFSVYNQTLRELNVEMDYLHVKSHQNFTASLYSKKGYNFTPATTKVIEDNFGGISKYLKDSSVSYSSSENIEMFRWHNGNSSNLKVTASIDEFMAQIPSQQTESETP